MIYDAYGLRISSEVPLPVPILADARSDVCVIRQPVKYGAISFRAAEGEDGDEDVWIEQGWDEGRVVLKFLPWVVAELMVDSPIVNVDVRDDDDPEYVSHLVLDQVIPQWLATRGHAVLHAGAAVSPRGDAVLMLGSTGSGKSTTTTALGAAGWDFISDDACRLMSTDSDGFAVVPSYPGVRLLEESRRALLPAAHFTPMYEGADKHRVVNGHRMAARPVPLGLIVELGSPAEHVTPRRLTLSEATTSLARHSFYLAGRSDAVASKAFIHASAIAMSIPCYRIDFPRRWDVFGELIEVIQELQPAIS